MKGEPCRRGAEILDRLTDDPSSRVEQGRWAVHVAECAACREHARALRVLVREAGRMAPSRLAEAAARQLEDSLFASIRSGDALRRPAVPSPVSTRRRLFALAASLALVAGAGVALWFALSPATGPSGKPDAGFVAAPTSRDAGLQPAPELVATVEAARGARLATAAGTDLVAGAALVPGAEATLAARSELVLRFADGSLAALRGPGRIAVLPDRRGLELRAGGVAVRAAKSEPGKGFVVRLADWRAEVVGTQFVVDAGGDGGSIAVLEGTVAVTLSATGRRWDVGAGEFLEPQVDVEPRALSAGEQALFAVVLPADPATAVTPSAPPAAPTSAADAGGAATEADATVLPSIPGPLVAVSPGSPPGPSVTERARQAMAAGDPAAAIATLEPDASQGRLGREGLALLADAYAADGRVDEAVDVYRNLAAGNPGSSTAENALYAATRLLLDRRGKPHEALDLLETLRRDFPRGALGEETAIAWFETLLRLRDARARAALEDYLARFPAGYRLAEASYLLGAQLQAEGVCARAVPLLQRYLELRANGTKADDARERIAACGGNAPSTAGRQEP